MNTKRQIPTAHKFPTGFKALVYLTACALNKTPPDTGCISDASIHKIFNLAHRQGVLAIAVSALELSSFDPRLTNNEIKQYTDYKVSCIRKRMLFDMERGEIFKQLDEMHIPHTPLKGIILQDMYPDYQLREMSDNDILVPDKDIKKICAIMNERGYTVPKSGVTYHVEFQKPPVYNFEFHRRLFAYDFSDTFADYYKNIGKKLIKDPAFPYLYNFSPEDFYIYTTAHAYRHFIEGGVGLKALADCFVYIKHFPNIDLNYIEKETEKLKIRNFEYICRRLSFKLFAKPQNTIYALSQLSKSEYIFLKNLAFSGSYSTEKDQVMARAKKITKSRQSSQISDRIKYYTKRLFPDDNYYKEVHPFIYKHSYLKPAFIVWRMIKGPATNYKKIIREIRYIQKNI